MNWEAISAIGQIVGAVGVMASLVYLAIQIRTTSEDVRDNTTFRIVQMLLESRRDLVDESFVAIRAKLGAGERLSPTEVILHMGHLQHLANVFDVSYLAIRRRKVDPALVPGLESRMRAFVGNAP